MARLRDDYAEFVSRGAVVIAVGPEGPGQFGRFWRAQRIPFIGIPDPEHRVARLYRQEVNLFKFGRMPAQVMIDRQGVALFVHYGHNIADIPPNEEILALLEALNKEVYASN